MKLIDASSVWESGKTYLVEGGRYRLEMHQAGFGMDVVDILQDGKFAHRIAGHDALEKAKRWVAERTPATTTRENSANHHTESP